MVAAAIRAAAGGVAVGADGVWGRSMCWQCNEAGIDAVACRTAKKHTAKDFELQWEIGGKVTLSVGGKQLRGTIVGFDWPSGLHSIEEAGTKARRVHHLKLRAFAGGLQYEAQRPGHNGGGGAAGGGPGAGAGRGGEDYGPAKITLGEGLDAD